MWITKYLIFQKVFKGLCPGGGHGTFSAPYFPIRTLLKLSKQDGSLFPLAAAALQTDIYMDDIVTGSNSNQETLKLKAELIALLQRGGFELREWASNDPSLISDLPASHVFIYFDPLGILIPLTLFIKH